MAVVRTGRLPQWDAARATAPPANPVTRSWSGHFLQGGRGPEQQVTAGRAGDAADAGAVDVDHEIAVRGIQQHVGPAGDVGAAARPLPQQRHRFGGTGGVAVFLELPHGRILSL